MPEHPAVELPAGIASLEPGGTKMIRFCQSALASLAVLLVATVAYAAPVKYVLQTPGVV